MVSSFPFSTQLIVLCSAPSVMGITVAASILAAIGIFMVLPFFIAEFFKKATDSATVLALIEGFFASPSYCSILVSIILSGFLTAMAYLSLFM